MPITPETWKVLHADLHPDQRHELLDASLLQARHEVYEAARQRHPNRWSKHTRDWSRKDCVHLNPDTPEPAPMPRKPL